MRGIQIAIAAAALVAGASTATTVSAAPLGADTVRAAADGMNLIENVQYVYLGHNYCWYDDGWMGPGWYWCGYGSRVGLGWGGPVGWRGWVWRGGRGVRIRGGVGFVGGARFGGHVGGHFGGGGHGHRSDIRLKEDIVPLARLDNGLGLYRFRYKGSNHTAYVGVMAQEVEAVDPAAVSRDRNGYLVVDYDRLGLRFMTWNEWLAANASSRPRH